MFKLLRPPQPITRYRKYGEKRISFNGRDKISLEKIQEVINSILEGGGCLKESHINIGYSCLIFTYKKDESDFELNQRQGQYKLEFQEFEAWKIKHASEIKEEMKKKIKDAAASIERDKKEITYLEHLYNCCECCEV